MDRHIGLLYVLLLLMLLLLMMMMMCDVFCSDTGFITSLY